MDDALISALAFCVESPRQLDALEGVIPTLHEYNGRNNSHHSNNYDDWRINSSTGLDLWECYGKLGKTERCAGILLKWNEQGRLSIYSSLKYKLQEALNQRKIND